MSDKHEPTGQQETSESQEPVLETKKNFVERKPEFIKDADRLCGDIILWTWDKNHQENALTLKEEASQLSEDVLRCNPDDVESDQHVRIGVRTMDLRREYVTLVNESLAKTEDEISFLRGKVEDVVDEINGVLDNSIRYKKVLSEADRVEPLVYNVSLLLEKTGYSSVDQIQEFYKSLKEQMKGQETSPSINLQIHALMDVLIRLKDAFLALDSLNKVQEEIVSLKDGTNEGPVDTLKLIKLEKKLASTQNKITGSLDLEKRSVNIKLSHDVDEKTSEDALNTTNQWFRNAKPGESLELIRQFISEEDRKAMKEKLSGADYSDVAIVNVEKKGEQYDIFVSEMLGVRSFINDNEYRLQSILSAISKTLQDQKKDIQLANPKEKDDEFEHKWKEYRHVDKEYRQLQMSFKNLSKEDAEFVALSLLAEIVKSKSMKGWEQNN